MRVYLWASVFVGVCVCVCVCVCLLLALFLRPLDPRGSAFGLVHLATSQTLPGSEGRLRGVLVQVVTFLLPVTNPSPPTNTRGTKHKLENERACHRLQFACLAAASYTTNRTSRGYTRPDPDCTGTSKLKLYLAHGHLDRDHYIFWSFTPTFITPVQNWRASAASNSPN
jgi:hypothetical protein